MLEGFAIENQQTKGTQTGRRFVQVLARQPWPQTFDAVREKSFAQSNRQAPQLAIERLFAGGQLGRSCMLQQGLSSRALMLAQGVARQMNELSKRQNLLITTLPMGLEAGTQGFIGKSLVPKEPHRLRQ